MKLNVVKLTTQIYLFKGSVLTEEETNLNNRYLESIENSKNLRNIKTRLVTEDQMYYSFDINSKTTIENVIQQIAKTDSNFISDMSIESRLIEFSPDEISYIYS